MTVFRRPNRFRKAWEQALQSFRSIRTKNTASKIEEQDSGNAERKRIWGRKPVLLAGGAALILAMAGLGGGIYVKANTVDYYEVLKDGKLIGSVSEPNEVEAMLLHKTKEINEKNPNVHMVLETGKITYGHKSAFKLQPDSEQTLRKLEASLGSHALGVEVRVGGKLIGIVKDKKTANLILERVQSKYVPQEKEKAVVQTLSYSSQQTSAVKPNSSITSVKFLEDVQTDETPVKPDRIQDANEVYKRLVTGSTKETKYVVQPGDCVGCIASKFDISPQVIYLNNPSVEDDIIKAGEVLDLTVLKPELTVQTVEQVTETETVEPKVIVQKNDQMKAGKSKVIREGVNGSRKVTYKLVKQNGYLMSEEMINQEVVKPSVPAIVMKGTKVIFGEGSGNFAWPVTGARITSGFGIRWGKLHKGIDMVGGSSIMAADNGVVVFAGTKNGYGNCIILDHKNGYQTVYGHMSKLNVKKGDIVEKGEKIGVMGNTGHSFGTHLHFEIHKNGDLKNPINYL